MESDFLKVAKEAALEAGKIIQTYLGKDDPNKKIKLEDPVDFVTEADIESEKIIVEILKTNFPEHNIRAEEQTNINNNSKFTWVIDPLDGSLSFIYGIPYFSVSIGLLEENEPILGVIYVVSFKKLYWAEKGKGSYLNGKAIKVNNKKSLDESIGVLDFGHNVKRQHKLNLYVNKLLSKIGYIYSFGGAGASLGMVAEGMLGLYVNHAFPWDFLAGAIVVTEAGGRVTDFDGNEPNWSTERVNLVASNGLVHDQILEALSNFKVTSR